MDHATAPRKPHSTDTPAARYRRKERSAMHQETLLCDLLSVLEARRARGDAATPEDLCRDHGRPELATELARRAAALAQMDGMFDTSELPTTVDNVGASPAAGIRP